MLFRAWKNSFPEDVIHWVHGTDHIVDYQVAGSLEDPLLVALPGGVLEVL